VPKVQVLLLRGGERGVARVVVAAARARAVRYFILVVVEEVEN